MMARPFYDDNNRQSRALESMKAAQAAAERAVADAKERNGADHLRARLMAAYDRCDAANRAELVRIAELACTAPGGIV